MSHSPARSPKDVSAEPPFTSATKPEETPKDNGPTKEEQPPKDHDSDEERRHRRKHRSSSHERRNSRERRRSKDRRRHYSKSPSPSHRSSQSFSNQEQTLYIVGLEPRHTEAEVKKFFSKFGTVLKATLVCDPRTKVNRGFCFVTMSNASELEAALNAKNPVVEGSAITIERARRTKARTPTPGTYLGMGRARGGGYSMDAPPRGYYPPSYGYADSYYPPSAYGAPRGYGGRYSPYRGGSGGAYPAPYPNDPYASSYPSSYSKRRGSSPYDDRYAPPIDYGYTGAYPPAHSKRRSQSPYHHSSSSHHHSSSSSSRRRRSRS